MFSFRRQWRLRKAARSLKVLMVEDDADLLASMMQFMKSEMGFDPLGAYDFSGAVVHLGNAMPDIVTIDLTLPSESGFELCEYIRAIPGFKMTPILVTGEAALPNDMAHAEEAGANLFLEKPFEMKTLGDNLAALVENPMMSRPGMRFLRLF